MQFTKYLTTVLTGHTTAETAYVVDDYPYGFRLRCKIRYWLEFKANQGFRLVSQTTNPKKTGEVWNKPKASTYSHLGVMGLDAEQHISWQGIHYFERQDIEEFQAVYGAHFDQAQKDVCAAMLAALTRYEERKLAAAAKKETAL